MLQNRDSNWSTQKLQTVKTKGEKIDERESKNLPCLERKTQDLKWKVSWPKQRSTSAALEKLAKKTNRQETQRGLH